MSGVVDHLAALTVLASAQRLISRPGKEYQVSDADLAIFKLFFYSMWHLAGEFSKKEKQTFVSNQLPGKLFYTYTVKLLEYM
jgi:hypothetical protein